MARARDVKITIEGEKELSRKLEQLGIEGRKALANAMKQAAEQVRDEAKRRAPVRTGNLQRHIIERKAFDDDYGVMYLVGPEYPQAAYGHIVEGGSSRMSPQPFLRPALDAVGSQAQQDAINALKKEFGL